MVVDELLIAQFFYTIGNQESGKYYLSYCFYGADTKNRTRDLLITNQLLYHLSYAGFLYLNETSFFLLDKIGVI